MRETKRLFAEGLEKEVLTVDNHADGVYLYLKMKEEGHERAEDVMSLLKMNGGNSTGNGIGCVSWDGSVHADQFWRHETFGNVKDRPFSEIWTDLSNPLMAKLKDKKPHVKGRCAKCNYLDICGGNFRVRAEAVHGDLWMEDPACFLTDEEIGIAQKAEN
jgi:radical SAM protein with 4Fe4S-binding SPASM domain